MTIDMTTTQDGWPEPPPPQRLPDIIVTDSGAGLAPVTALVVTYNSADLLPDFFAALGPAIGDRSVDVVVVDNNSTDDTLVVAERLWPSATVIATGTNRGFAAAINRGVLAAPEDAHVLILNPDIRLGHDAIDRLADVADGDRVGLVAPLLEDETGHRLNSIMRFPQPLMPWGQVVGLKLADRLGISKVETDPIQYTLPHEVPWSTGGAIMMARRTVRRVGPWTEDYFLYTEETDYCKRVRDAGLKTVFEPSATAVRRLDGDPNPTPVLYGLMVYNDYRFFSANHSFMQNLVYKAGQAAFLLSRLPMRPEHGMQALKALFLRNAPARKLLAERLADKPA